MMKEKAKVVFFGSDAIALPSLEVLVGCDSVRLMGIVTRPDRPSGRGMRVRANPVKAWATARNLPVRQPGRPGPEEDMWLREIGCDLILVMAYGRILKRSVIEIPRHGIFNLHASLLPKYRGASPIEGAIASGEKETGVSLMRLVPKMDSGPVMDTERVSILAEDTAVEVRKRLAGAAEVLLERCLPKVLSGKAHFNDQDDDGVSYTRMLDKRDGALDFRASADQLVDRYRALQPWPGSYFEAGKTRLRVGRCERGEAEGNACASPGVVLPGDRSALRIATGGGVFIVRELQRPGGRMLPAADFLNGFPICPGVALPLLTMAPLVAKDLSSLRSAGAAGGK